MTNYGGTKPRQTFYYKVFRVRRADGRVTTVSVDPELVEAVSKKLGSTKAASDLVRKAAFDYTESEELGSCSKFVQRRLAAALAETGARAGPSTGGKGQS